MNSLQSQISDLQEITFWQQLNRQLIEKRRLGAPITDENQKAFQKFCFDNQLFHKITEDPLIDELTMALVILGKLQGALTGDRDASPVSG